MNHEGIIFFILDINIWNKSTIEYLRATQKTHLWILCYWYDPRHLISCRLLLNFSLSHQSTKRHQPNRHQHIWHCYWVIDQDGTRSKTKPKAKTEIKTRPRPSSTPTQRQYQTNYQPKTNDDHTKTISKKILRPGQIQNPRPDPEQKQDHSQSMKKDLDWD